MKIMYCALGPFQMSFVIKVHKQLKDRWLKFEFFINFNRHDYFLLSVKLYSINNKHVILM